MSMPPKWPHSDRMQVQDNCVMLGADQIKYTMCDYCDNIHITFYNDRQEPFAYATIGLDQLDGQMQQLRILRNDILARRAKNLNDREDIGFIDGQEI